MSFYTDMEKSLLEAIEIEKGNIPLERHKDMPTPTYFVPNDEEKIIDELVRIRKAQNISQKELAELVGTKQQVISRIELKKHNPSFKMVYCIMNVLGYDMQLVKKEKEEL